MISLAGALIFFSLGVIFGGIVGLMLATLEYRGLREACEHASKMLHDVADDHDDLPPTAGVPICQAVMSLDAALHPFETFEKEREDL